MISLAYTPLVVRQSNLTLLAKVWLLSAVVTAHLGIVYIWRHTPTRENIFQVSELSVSLALAAHDTPANIQQRKAMQPHVPVVDKPAPMQSAAAVEQIAVATAAIVDAHEPIPEASEPEYKASYLHNNPPAYPLAARRMGLQGRVVLHVEVLAGGKCGNIEIHKSSGYIMLDNAALETVKTWRFVPARQAGNSVDKWFMIPVQFSLKDNA